MIVASVIAAHVAVKNPAVCNAARPTAVTNRVRKGASTIGIASAPTAAACKLACRIDLPFVPVPV